MRKKRALTQYISANPAVYHGKLVFRGTRIPIATVFEYLAAGMTIDDILRGYPSLNRRAIQAAIQYAACRLGEEEFIPLAKAA